MMEQKFDPKTHQTIPYIKLVGDMDVTTLVRAYMFSLCT